MGAVLRIEVAVIRRSAGSLLISDPKLTDNSAISGVWIKNQPEAGPELSRHQFSYFDLRNFPLSDFVTPTQTGPMLQATRAPCLIIIARSSALR
jgi:hypothetical protein